MHPRLTITAIAGPHQGQELVSIDRTLITIGRSSECHFQLRGDFEDLIVSRRHCLIEVHPDWVEIRDLESRHGTFVNGQRLGYCRDAESSDQTMHKRELHNGDEIRVGSSILRVRLRDNATEVVQFNESEPCLA